MNLNTLIIGTRGSALALAQTTWIQKEIARRFPSVRISIKIIKTSADKDTTTSLRSVPTAGVFVKELEQALLRKEIDLAVHSMKDVPTQIAGGLQISAIPEREDVRDAFICNIAANISEIPQGARIGTGSFRRQAQLLALRPDLEIVDIRGNVDTRIKKMENKTCDAVVLACAGLRRLGLQNRIASVLNYQQMLPAPGQGALAVETRAGESELDEITARLNHPPSALAVFAERDFLERLGGGCNVPIAVYARVNQNLFEMDGLVASPDGQSVVRDSIKEQLENRVDAVASLTERILAKGGREILENFRCR